MKFSLAKGKKGSLVNNNLLPQRSHFHYSLPLFELLAPFCSFNLFLLYIVGSTNSPVGMYVYLRWF